MRTLLLFFLLAPTLAFSQVNRSARELAQETTRDYIEKKLFKGQSYVPGKYGEVKPFKDKNDIQIEWIIDHEFDINRPPRSFDNEKGGRTSYHFLFYLDHQMKVKRASSYSRS